MSCLVIAYVTVVILVTRMHMIIDDRGEGLLSAKERIDQGKQSRQETRAEKEKRNPFRKHHLENKFGHGVTPDVVVPPDGGEEPPIVVAQKDDHPTPEHILAAYMEPQNTEEWNVQPLPVRQKAKKENLQQVRYPRLNSCSKLPQQWPVDDTPTDADPFLPWIHDVFPTADGKYIQFVAQNKRRCKTGKDETDILAFMNPQAALFQHVPVQRLIQDGTTTRYRLSSHEEADPDGITTRFICRFKPSMEETLSTFNFDYDWTAFRKRYRGTFLENDGGIKSIHTSQLIFQCPVPESLQETIRTGASVVNDWASLFLDLIPIRTPPRFGRTDQFFQPQYSEFQAQGSDAFDPVAMWGNEHVLPTIEDSGRWENIPICKPSLLQYEDQPIDDLPAKPETTPQKKHRLVSCIWASAGYATRGNRFAVNDGQRRLLEWITYNKLIGFDHFYLYDNSGAFRNDTSLKPIADLFPGEVTYIPWPSQVCNNNPNNVDSPGERSSQYAAESSCRLRFGPHVDWVGQFDIDEYFVPMGNYTNALDFLDDLDKEDTRIASFGSWRAWPRRAFIAEPEPINDPAVCWHNEPCFHLQIPSEHTMLQAYNCDRQPPGQKTQVMPAEKQFYKPDYVLQHFIHYSAATVLSEKNRSEYEKDNRFWSKRAFPDPRQRFGNELTEGLMIHTKAVAIQDTAGWERMCHIDNLKLPKRKQGLCRLGLPWPKDATLAAQNATKEGWAYNCYVNEKVENYLVPRLQTNLAERAHFFDNQQ